MAVNRPTFANALAYAVAATVLLVGALASVAASSFRRAAIPVLVFSLGVAWMVGLQGDTVLAGLVMLGGGVMAVVAWRGAPSARDEHIRGRSRGRLVAALFSLSAIVAVGVGAAASHWVLGAPGQAGADSGAGQWTLLARALHNVSATPVFLAVVLLVASGLVAVLLMRDRSDDGGSP